MNYKLNTNLAYLKLSRTTYEKLSLINKRTVKGSDTVLTTPLIKRISPDNLLKAVDDLFKINGHLINSKLSDLESLNRSKFGPRSIAIPWSDRRKGFLESFENSSGKVPALNSDPKFRSDFHSLRPISLSNALKFLKNDTNSGLPFLSRKGDVKNVILDDFDTILKAEYPAVLFTRTQENNKTRDVYGFGIADTLNEMRFYQPLLNYQKKLSWRSSLRGPEEVDLSVTKLIDQAMLRNLSLVSIDFSRYDSTVRPELQKYCFDYISKLFQTEYKAELDYIANRFKSIGVVTPDGVYSGDHGVPSGSTFTNEVDSIAQYLIAISTDFIFSENIDIQGDDGIYAVTVRSKDIIFDSFEKFGLVPNRDKSYIFDDAVIYLQKLFDVYYRDKSNGIIGGIYPIYRALNRLIYQERWSDFEEFGISGKDYYSIRAITILENCKHHPLFKDFVKLIVSIDKYSINPSDSSISKYVQMISEKSGIEGMLINQYGDNLKGIRNFDTFKIVRQLTK